MTRFIMSMHDSDYQGIALCRVQGGIGGWRRGLSHLGIWVSAGKLQVPKPKAVPIC